MLGEAAQFPFFFNRIFVIAVIRLDVILMQVGDFDMFLFCQFLLDFRLAMAFTQGRREGIEDSGDEDDSDNCRNDVDQGIHGISNPFQ